MSRRTMVLLAGVILLLGSMTVSAMTFQEAPMLQEKVQAGELPPLEERLPAEPLVWDNEWNHVVGTYGGELRFSTFRFRNALSCIGIARYTKDRRDWVPDLAKGWEWSDDYSSLTVFFREGTRWSDGHPFTTDDFMFWWNDIVHSEYLDAPMGVTGIDTRRDEVVQVDDYTIRFDFAEPRPGFFFMTRGMDGGDQGIHFSVPKHYMKQFHPTYSPIEGKDPEEQFLEFMDLAGQREWRDVERPVLWPWRPIAYREDQLSLWERNPYFWVVDTDGNQLPYIDTLQSPLLRDGDREAINLRLIAGDLDWERRIGSVLDMPLYERHREEAGFQIMLTAKPEGSQQGIYFNLNNRDPALAELVAEADFRRALSLTVDREVINETAYFGLGRPGHGFSMPNEYDPEIDGLWAQYDMELANSLLDGIGLDTRGADGFRLLPNGESFVFSLMYVPGWHPGAQETAEIAVEGWQELGINAVATAVDHSLRGERETTHNYDAVIRPWSGGFAPMAFRYGWTMARWAPAYWAYWTNRHLAPERRPASAQEIPDGIVREMAVLQERLEATAPFTPEYDSLLHEWKTKLADNVFIMGIVQDVPHVLLANKNLRNLPGEDGERILLGAGDEEFYPRSWFFVQE